MVLSAVATSMRGCILGAGCIYNDTNIRLHTIYTCLNMFIIKT